MDWNLCMDWLPISVSSWQQGHMWQMVWFGWLSVISQLARRVGEGGGVGQTCLHSITQPDTTWPPGGESSDGGLRSLPLLTALYNLDAMMPEKLLYIHIQHAYVYLENGVWVNYAVCLCEWPPGAEAVTPCPLCPLSNCPSFTLPPPPPPPPPTQYETQRRNY